MLPNTQDMIQMCSFDATKSTKGASKLRRDLINAEIANLRDLLPLPSSTRQRLSQLQLMALVCVYVRKANYFQQVFRKYDVSDTMTPNFGFSKAMSGFLMMMTQNGKLLYISDNAAEYLGHSMEDLLIHGDSVYDIIDKQDHQAVQTELMRGGNGGGRTHHHHHHHHHHHPMTSSSTSGYPDEDQQQGDEDDDDDDDNVDRHFLCRMNVSRNARRQMRFGDQKVVLMHGHFLSFLPLCSRNEPVFLATCTPVAMPETRECVVQGSTNIFTSIHTMDMKFVHVDNNGEFHLGQCREKLLGTSWYHLIHSDCIREAQTKHRMITQTDQDRACILLLRLHTAHSVHSVARWMWVHVVLQVKDNMEGSQHPVIVCTNQVLSEREACVMRANSWLYHYYTVQSKLQYSLAVQTESSNSTPTRAGTGSVQQPAAAAATYYHQPHESQSHEAPSTLMVNYPLALSAGHHYHHHHQQHHVMATSGGGDVGHRQHHYVQDHHHQFQHQHQHQHHHHQSGPSSSSNRNDESSALSTSLYSASLFHDHQTGSASTAVIRRSSPPPPHSVADLASGPVPQYLSCSSSSLSPSTTTTMRTKCNRKSRQLDHDEDDVTSVHCCVPPPSSSSPLSDPQTVPEVVTTTTTTTSGTMNTGHHHHHHHHYQEEQYVPEVSSVMPDYYNCGSAWPASSLLRLHRRRRLGSTDTEIVHRHHKRLLRYHHLPNGASSMATMTTSGECDTLSLHTSPSPIDDGDDDVYGDHDDDEAGSPESTRTSVVVGLHRRPNRHPSSMPARKRRLRMKEEEDDEDCVHRATSGGGDCFLQYGGDGVVVRCADPSSSPPVPCACRVDTCLPRCPCLVSSSLSIANTTTSGATFVRCCTAFRLSSPSTTHFRFDRHVTREQTNGDVEGNTLNDERNGDRRRQA